MRRSARGVASLRICSQEQFCSFAVSTKVPDTGHKEKYLPSKKPRFESLPPSCHDRGSKTSKVTIYHWWNQHSDVEERSPRVHAMRCNFLVEFPAAVSGPLLADRDVPGITSRERAGSYGERKDTQQASSCSWKLLPTVLNVSLSALLVAIPCRTQSPVSSLSA